MRKVKEKSNNSQRKVKEKSKKKSEKRMGKREKFKFKKSELGELNLTDRCRFNNK
jgi:hypothetical protein